MENNWLFKDIDDGTGKKETRLKIARIEKSDDKYNWNFTPVNEWSTASLKTYLNNDLYIDSGSLTMFESAIWNLGGWHNSSLYANQFYEYERGTNVYQGHSTKWTGGIALMYPSDYMYAQDLSRCNKMGSFWDEDCSPWLRISNLCQWTLSPNSSNSERVFIITYYGDITNDAYEDASGRCTAVPVLFLKSTVQITGGDGTQSNPYTLG